MEMVIALGANLGDRKQTFAKAIAAIGEQIGAVIARSKWIETEPLLAEENPIPDQPPYLNAVIAVHSDLSPQEVMKKLLAIELALGRDRSETREWAPRVIDLDLICCGNEVLMTPDLMLPHPEMHKRLFVLEPMLEVTPNWVHPLIRKDIKQMVEALKGRADAASNG